MIKKKPKISVVCSAYRTQNWMALYNSLNTNNNVLVDFIFVGPNTPKYQLPKNFRFIKSDVKPVQCYEIAYRSSLSDYVFNCADDCFFKESYPLDKLYKKYCSYNTDKLIVSPRYQMDSELMDLDTQKLDQADPSSPAMPCGSFMSRKLYNKLGGIDKNFVAILWDLDIALRVYSIGGQVVYSNEVTVVEDRMVASAGGSVCIDYYKSDREYLDSIWKRNAKGIYKRSKSPDSFSDKDISLYSQGPRGRWRGKNIYLFQLIIDSPRFFNKFCSKLIRGLLKPKMYFNYFLRLLTLLNLNKQKFYEFEPDKLKKDKNVIYHPPKVKKSKKSIK